MTDTHFHRQSGTPLQKPLALLVRQVTRWPRTTLAISCLLSGLALVTMACRLEFRTRRLDLINPASQYNQRWLDFIGDFGNKDDAVLVVEGPNASDVRHGIDWLTTELTARPQEFLAVLGRIDLDRLARKRLHYLDNAQLAEVERFLISVAPSAPTDWHRLAIRNQLAIWASASTSQEAAEAARAGRLLTHHLDNLRHAVEGGSSYQSPWSLFTAEAGRSDPFAARYLSAKQGTLGIILVRLASNEDSFAPEGAAINQLRAVVEQARQEHPQLEVGLTGLPVMENDEMQASRNGSLKAGALSLVGVVCLFAIGFGGFRHPLMTVATLMVGLAWTCGYLTLTIGHLNILSMSFGAILIGMGIDFGIHFVARYLRIRADADARLPYQRSEAQQPESRQARVMSAVVQTTARVGPGIVMGGITSAIAFYVAGVSEFTGLAELGWIAGGGVLLCVASALVVLPALILLVDSGGPEKGIPRPLSLAKGLGLLERWPRIVLTGSGLLLIVATWGLPNLHYDHNLLNLQPLGLESVALEERLLHETNQSVWYALSITESVAELRQRKAAFERLSTVSRTEEIVSLLPEDGERNQQALQKIQHHLQTIPAAPPLIPIASLAELTDTLTQAAEWHAQRSPSSSLRERLMATARWLEAQQPQAVYRGVTRYQQFLVTDLLQRLEMIQESAHLPPPTLTDLPASLTTRFVGKSGRHLLKVYSNADIWDMDRLERFVQEVRSVDPQATGKPLQTYEASRQLQQSYVHTAWLALAAVSVILWLDMRCWRDVLLALFPVSAGLLLMLGCMGWLDIPLNPANMIVLPLILGIGLDDGVHVLHDYRRSSKVFRLHRATATAILLTSLTTMIGFGSLMLAEHRGLASLGRVLTLGVTCCFFLSVATLPALLRLLPRRPEQQTVTVGQPAAWTDDSASPSRDRAEDPFPAPEVVLD